MTEKRIAGFLDRKNYIYRRFVALVAIFLDAEDGRAVMTHAAGSPFFHLGHGYPLVIRPGIIGLVMTIAAGMGTQMLIMIETGII